MDFDDFDNVDGDLEELESGWGSAEEGGMIGGERSVDSYDGGDGTGGSTEQLRSYKNGYRLRGADSSPPRILYRSVSPSPAAIPSQSQKPDNKEKDKDKDKDKTLKTKPKAEKKKFKQKEHKGPPGSTAGSGDRKAHV